MRFAIEKIFLWWLFYSVVGWVWETGLNLVLRKKWVDRGILNGPLCPIYGFGAAGMVGQSFGSVAGIILIVAAGGGFKQTLVDSGIGDVIASSITESAMNPLIAGWLVAVLIRLATGSATVATVTASGIMVPLATGMSPTHLALLVLAIGAGSVFFSHLNDAGFWLVKEYFGMTVGQTLKTWSLMETVLSVVGLGGVMLLSLVL